MLAMSLARRAYYHGVLQNWSHMDLDTAASLASAPKRWVVRANLLNCIAVLYADVAPRLAEPLTHEAGAVANQGGFAGQARQSLDLLRRLERQAPRMRQGRQDSLGGCLAFGAGITSDAT
jgi:hypothetical protein